MKIGLLVVCVIIIFELRLFVEHIVNTVNIVSSKNHSIIVKVGFLAVTDSCPCYVLAERPDSKEDTLKLPITAEESYSWKQVDSVNIYWNKRNPDLSLLVDSNSYFQRIISGMLLYGGGFVIVLWIGIYMFIRFKK